MCQMIGEMRSAHKISVGKTEQQEPTCSFAQKLQNTFEVAGMIIADSDVRGLDRYNKHHYLKSKDTHCLLTSANKVTDFTKLDKCDCFSRIKCTNMPTVL